ncbi:Wall-associated receptor kinase 5 [Dichanthelium oligosanthes]|uniref:Wall-associated receptor kinase 5 n=1 Tax=Dichanthelium oligosanthes TaxID=888268 RepID=A0A1E5UM93_9POAL|nr:Wall-associated receptor kinase 5 [Dichanthelium oligosanthes]
MVGPMNRAISFMTRLKIAHETAEALAYLHSWASPPIIHGDVKSLNILIDDDYTAKVADIGASILAPTDGAQFVTFVQGTYGYLDPEYMQTSKLTSKSDVYSFGVVLLELLTCRKAMNLQAFEEEKNLSSHFLLAVSENRLDEILDEQIKGGQSVELIEELAELAKECLEMASDKRPSMREIAEELDRARKLLQHPWGQQTSDEERKALLVGSPSTCPEIELSNGCVSLSDSACLWEFNPHGDDDIFVCLTVPCRRLLQVPGRKITAMEPQKLRVVRCPRCSQLLVEQPSIPVYKCGGCGTVLRAKNRAVPVAQVGSGSDQHNSFPCSLQGSPQSGKSICSDEQKAVSSVDQPRGATVDGSISSTIDNIDSCKGAISRRAMPAVDTVTRDEHLNEEEGSLIDGNIQNTEEDMVKQIHDKDSGADTSSNLTEKLGSLDTSENPNGGKVDGFATSDVSTLNGKTKVVHREERLQSYEDMHVESHEALIEELERSLSFSSDDEYFSDEAENIGLSDALRNQMGSRRFMLGVKVNDASRSDPHGRLIEELEMSFSDAEEPMEQHAVVVERVHGNVHDMSAHPCEESLSSFDNGHLKYEQTYHQEIRLIGNDTKVKEECNAEENCTANYAAEDIADSSHESGKDWQSIDVEIADPCEGSVSLFGDRNIKDHSNDAMEECHTEDNSTANRANGNANIVVADEDIVEVYHENSKDQQFTDAESAHPFEGSVSSVDDGNEKLRQRFQQNDLIADATQETEEGCIEDDNVDNYVHGIENLVFPNEDISDRPCGNEGLMADCRAGENEEGHMEDDNMANAVDANENVVVADDHIAERVDDNEVPLLSGDMDNTESLEAERTHLGEEVLSSLSTGHIKSEQSLQQNELISDGTKEKEEADMEDGNARATVASFPSLSYKRAQHKVPSFNKNKEEIPYGYKANQLRQGLSLDSGDLKSIQNFIESQIDGTSSSRSSGSPSQGVLVHRTSNKFNNVVRHERLKKMDELRDQLSRLSSQKVSEKSYQKGDQEYQQQPNSCDVEQHLQSVDGDSIPSSGALESYYGHGRPPRYQPSNPFSPTHTYTHCHFGHAQTRIPHNYDPWEFNSYYQPSYAESTILDYESLRSSYKEQKRAVRKHILRPLSGASPYTICNSCFNLVQMPSDIYISKAKIGKMQCGKCSKVLALSFPSVHQATAKISMDVAQQSYNPYDSTIQTNEDITSYYAECLTGVPVSTSEDYGASYTRTLPTQAGSSSLAATQSGKKISDSALHRLMGYDSASQLLCQSRVFDDGYESFESMVPVSSRVSRRKNK